MVQIIYRPHARLRMERRKITEADVEQGASEMAASVQLSDEGDLLYVHLRDGEVAVTKSFGDDRLVDVDADGAVLGVEFIGIDGEIDLRGLPDQQAIQDAIDSSAVASMNVRSDSAAA